jgi:hypothetical protein
MKTDRKALYEEFMSSDKSITEMATVHSKSKQWISWSILQYIKAEGIKFYTVTKDVCIVCDKEFNKSKTLDESFYLRKDIERVIIEKGICPSCRESNTVKCRKCGEMVTRDSANTSNNVSWVCRRCSNKSWLNWYTKNKEKVKKYNKDRRERLLNESLDKGRCQTKADNQ